MPPPPQGAASEGRMSLEDMDDLLLKRYTDTAIAIEALDLSTLEPAAGLEQRTKDLLRGALRELKELNLDSKQMPQTFEVLQLYVTEQTKTRALLTQIQREMHKMRRLLGQSYVDHHAYAVGHLTKRELNRINLTNAWVPRASTGGCPSTMEPNQDDKPHNDTE